MNARDKAIKELEQNGYQFARHGSNHDLYINRELKHTITLKRHQVTEDTLRYIRKEIKQNRSGMG